MNEGFDYSQLYGAPQPQPQPPEQPVTEAAAPQPEPAPQPVPASKAYTEPEPPAPAETAETAVPGPQPQPPQEPVLAAPEPQPPQAPVPPTPEAAAPIPEPQPQAPAPAAYTVPDNYPNVGSSGMNTANTARTDYSENAAYNTYNTPGWQAAGQQPYYRPAPPQPEPGPAPRPGYGPRPGQTQQNGYYSSMGGGNGYNGYSYSSAPQQPPVQRRNKKKPGGAKKVLLRLVAGLAILALGFAGGLGGAMVAARMGLVGSPVVLNTVPRGDSSEVSMGSTNGASLSLQEVAAIVKPSVVVIVTEQMVSGGYNWFGGGYVESGAGSGVVMTEDGYILTCAHVITGAQNIRVTLNSDEEYTASVVGYDSTADIAVLKIDATGLTPAIMGDSDALAVGESVVAVGNPLGMLGNTVTNGIVSAINREVQVENNRMTLIQTNAAISPGNSGGGLFNANGELIGIVNAKSSSTDSSGNMTDAEGLGFAIPVNTALQVAQDLISVGYVQRPVLGIQVLTINNAQDAMQYGVTSYGVYILRVDAGGGAEKAGLRMGDRIMAVDGIVVNQNSDLTDYLAEKAVGDVVTLQIERDGRVLTFDVTLGASQG